MNKYDTKPKRRLFETLKAQGLQMNQQVVFLSDGGETIRDLQSYLSPESEHWLDWFHITMRLTVMGQMLKGAATEITKKATNDQDDEFPTGEDIQDVEKNLESLKWNLWHGNVYRSLQVVDRLEFDLEAIAEYSESAKKLLRTLCEFGHYIKANRVFIPNFGDRYRHGEAISTAFVESAVNQVVSKRMVKRQQMRWSQRGAHLLLQVRTRALDGVLRDDFVRWHPGMKPIASAQPAQHQNAAQPPVWNALVGGRRSRPQAVPQVRLTWRMGGSSRTDERTRSYLKQVHESLRCEAAALNHLLSVHVSHQTT